MFKNVVKFSTGSSIFITLLVILMYWVVARADAMPVCTLTFDKNIVLKNVPLAETEVQRQKGLSGENAVGVGMLFGVPEARLLSFWMRDTKVPLAIGFVSAEGVLFQIEDMQPETDTLHNSTQPARYALELPQGKFADYGLRIGAVLNDLTCH